MLYACSNSSTEIKNNHDSENSEQIDINEQVSDTTITNISEATALDSTKNANQVELQTSKYICPNSCPDGRLNKPGDCPTCGMELIENLEL